METLYERIKKRNSKYHPVVVVVGCVSTYVVREMLYEKKFKNIQMTRLEASCINIFSSCYYGLPPHKN